MDNYLEKRIAFLEDLLKVLEKHNAEITFTGGSEHTELECWIENDSFDFGNNWVDARSIEERIEYLKVGL